MTVFDGGAPVPHPSASGGNQVPVLTQPVGRRGFDLNQGVEEAVVFLPALNVGLGLSGLAPKPWRVL